MIEKPWRECGDYLKKLPETRLLGIITLPEGARFDQLRSFDTPTAWPVHNWLGLNQASKSTA